MPLSRLFEVLFDNPVVAKYPIFLPQKAQKQVCQKDRCCPSAKKKDIQLQNLPIFKMNCADSTEHEEKAFP